MPRDRAFNFGGKNYEPRREGEKPTRTGPRHPRRPLHRPADGVSRVHFQPVTAGAPNRAGRGDVEPALQGRPCSRQIGRFDRNPAES
jgi:hypothetical protein